MTRECLLQCLQAETDATLAAVARELPSLTETCSTCDGSGLVEVGGGVNGNGPDRRERTCPACLGRKVVTVRCCGCHVRPAVMRQEDDPLCAECAEKWAEVPT